LRDLVYPAGSMRHVLTPIASLIMTGILSGILFDSFESSQVTANRFFYFRAIGNLPESLTARQSFDGVLQIHCAGSLNVISVY
jgi:hypothetical protein